jgi:hypothetical protein
LGSFIALIASFAGSLFLVPWFERLFAYIASVSHAFVKIVSGLFCCSVFTTSCRIARHAQRISLSVSAPHFLASSTVTAIALRVVGKCVRQINARSAVPYLNFVNIAESPGVAA